MGNRGKVEVIDKIVGLAFAAVSRLTADTFSTTDWF
jgi:hypothetical protein